MSRVSRGIWWLGAALAVACLALGGAGQAAAASKHQLKMEDTYAKEWKQQKAQASDQQIVWKMSDTWGGTKVHDLTLHFAQAVEAASGGRLKIKVFPTGAICGAFELFDTVAKGTLDAGHSWPGYWKGKNEAFVLFASVPFGMDFESFNIWWLEGGGRQLMNELYGKFGLKPFICGDAGQELGLFSSKAASKMEDFKGMRARTAGWYMDILNELDVAVTPLPGSEIYLGLERGVIDAAEFSAPSITYPMGFHEVAKFVIEPGVHQPGDVFDLFINEKSWQELPQDLKNIVQICAMETHLWSYSWFQYHNIEALERLREAGVEFVKMDQATRIEFRKQTQKYLEQLKAKYPDVKKILNSQEQFLKDFAFWRELRGGVSPWPYEDYVEGKHFE
jgi:TRAP-type mannitol/chloroaromatic compound transport system substrate-binding protein